MIYIDQLLISGTRTISFPSSRLLKGLSRLEKTLAIIPWGNSSFETAIISLKHQKVTERGYKVCLLTWRSWHIHVLLIHLNENGVILHFPCGGAAEKGLTSCEVPSKVPSDRRGSDYSMRLKGESYGQNNMYLPYYDTNCTIFVFIIKCNAARLVIFMN